MPESRDPSALRGGNETELTMKRPDRIPCPTTSRARRPHRFLAAVLVLCAPQAARASVDWQPWTLSNFQSHVDRAAREKRLVLLVVSQPDWCPPCIKLDRNWLKNGAETKVAGLTSKMIALEVHGYDQPGAALLKDQDVRFQGTPTTYLFRPETPGESLGEARLLGAIVGAPDDFPARLAKLTDGSDGLAAAKSAVASASTPLAKATALLDLARVHVARGEAPEADLAYEQAIVLGRAAKGDSLWKVQRDAEWERAAELVLRVRKDYPAALKRIDAFIAKHDRPADMVETIAYARAWALGNLGRVDEALIEMETGVVSAGTAAAYDTFGYFAFRLNHPRVLARGEQVLREGCLKYPGDASLHQELGRVLRRQHRFREAEAEFAEAVKLAIDESERVTYQAQLDHVRGEVVSRPATSAAAASESSEDKPKRKIGR